MLQKFTCHSGHALFGHSGFSTNDRDAHKWLDGPKTRLESRQQMVFDVCTTMLDFPGGMNGRRSVGPFGFAEWIISQGVALGCRVSRLRRTVGPKGGGGFLIRSVKGTVPILFGTAIARIQRYTTAEFGQIAFSKARQLSPPK
jgi:hypothetical protein